MTIHRPLFVLGAVGQLLLAPACVVAETPATDPSEAGTTDVTTSGPTEPDATTSGPTEPDATTNGPTEPDSTTADPMVTTTETTGQVDTGTVDTSETGTNETDEPEPSCVPEPFPPVAVEDDGYRHFELCGWPVYMDIELFDGELGDDVYYALAEDLGMVISVLPPVAVEFLRDTNFWMELDVGFVPGAVYHPSAQWLQDNGYPTKWAQGVQFGNAQNYLTWVAQQPAMVLHELSHAWDHQRNGFAHPDVLAAYDGAMQAGLYDAVEYIDGQILEAYATTNAAEYFAELSEAYYWSNDFEPFVRDELATFDPQGMAAIEAAWELP
jgi:hypothetical protein